MSKAIMITCLKDGERVEREVDYFERATSGRPSFPIPKLLPGEEARYTISGDCYIYDTLKQVDTLVQHGYDFYNMEQAAMPPLLEE